MSDVNQAFLRAYLKNRASQTEPSPSAPEAAPSAPGALPSVSRPTATAPRLPSVPPIQPSQTLPSGMKLRFDPTHAAPNTAKPTQPTSPLPFVPPSQTLPTQARVSPKQGIWSPLGAERGMKAMESTSIPAVVRNGVTAVTREAAQYRRPTVETAPQNVVGPQKAPVVPQSLPNSPSSGMSYDQVVYVDGLGGQQLPNARTNDRTLAQITEPIAFGTGAPSVLPHSKRTQSSDNFAIPAVQSTSPSTPASFASPTAKDATITRRFDSAQRTSDTESAASTSSTKKNAAANLNSGLPLPVAFNPSWEVDLFYWPEVVKQIEASHSDAFRQVGKHLSLANRDGLKVMAITSGERGVGRSTVSMHMARCAANAGLRVALVDGDTYCPSLIDQLRLDMQQGWQDCLFENVPLHEIAIHSIADRITLFPLTSVISQQQVHANLHRMAKLIRRISNAFDIVFIDANRLNLEQRDMVGVDQESVVDAAIVVVDIELSIKEKVDSAVSILQRMGIASIGLVENFQS